MQYRIASGEKWLALIGDDADFTRKRGVGSRQIAFVALHGKIASVLIFFPRHILIPCRSPKKNVSSNCLTR